MLKHFFWSFSRTIWKHRQQAVRARSLARGSAGVGAPFRTWLGAGRAGQPQACDPDYASSLASQWDGDRSSSQDCSAHWP